MLKDENTLTYLANQIKGLGQTEGATVEITQATLRNGESVFVGGYQFLSKLEQGSAR